MKNNRQIVRYMIYILLGGVLFGLGVAGIVDEFWGGMGSGFLFVGILQGIRMYRIHKDENYREAVEIAASDERNRFLRNKAWAWAGYLFILISGVAVIVLQILGRHQQSQMAAYGVCLMLILYYGSYLILRKKY